MGFVQYVGCAVVLVLMGFLIWFAIDRVKKNKERQAAIKNFAKIHNLEYQQEISGFPVEYRFKLSDIGHSQRFEAVMMGEKNGVSFVTFDYTFIVGHGKGSKHNRTTVCLLSTDEADFLDFFLREKYFRVGGLEAIFGTADIKFPNDKSFSDRFVLEGVPEEKVITFFDFKRRNIFLTFHKNGYAYEAHGDTFAIMANGYMMPGERIRFMHECMNLYCQLVPSIKKDALNSI